MIMEHWTENHQSFKYSKKTKNLSVSFTCLWAYAELEAPELGSRFYEDDPTFIDFVLDDIEVSKAEGGLNAIVTLKYIIPENKGFEPENNDPIYSLSDGGLEKELETHPDYKTNWNYCLAAEKTVTSSPSWWLTATDLSMSSSDGEKYRWVTDSNSIAEGWYILKEAQKQGIQSYILPSPTVTTTIYYARESDANNAANKVGQKETPPKTFGVIGGEWLVIGAEKNEERNWHVVRKTYQWANSWDSDLYN